MSGEPRQSSVTGRYILNRDPEYLLGRGSFANVYKGVDKLSKRAVAIKVVDRGNLSDALKNSLSLEVATMSAVVHAHAIRFFECFENSRFREVCIVTELCDIGNLSQYLKSDHSDNPELQELDRNYPRNPSRSVSVPRNGRKSSARSIGGLNEVLCRHFAKQIVSAISYLHSQNIIHRDIKPQNILLTSSSKADIFDSELPGVGVGGFPVAKVADFGFARVLGEARMAETLCGSPLYMAPEILSHQKYDASADLWSLGTVIYEMLVGCSPYTADSPGKLLEVIKDAKGVIDYYRVKVSADMKMLIEGLLRVAPSKRLSLEAITNHPTMVDPIPNLRPADQKKEIVHWIPDIREGSTKEKEATSRTSSPPSRDGSAGTPRTERWNGIRTEARKARTTSQVPHAPHDSAVAYLPRVNGLTASPRAGARPEAEYPEGSSDRQTRRSSAIGVPSTEPAPASTTSNPSSKQGNRVRPMTKQEVRELESSLSDYVLVTEHVVKAAQMEEELQKWSSGRGIRRANSTASAISSSYGPSAATTAPSTAAPAAAESSRPRFRPASTSYESNPVPIPASTRTPTDRAAAGSGTPRLTLTGDTSHHRTEFRESRDPGDNGQSVSAFINRALAQAAARIDRMRILPSGARPETDSTGTVGGVPLGTDRSQKSDPVRNPTVRRSDFGPDGKVLMKVEELADRSDVVYHFARVKMAQLELRSRQEMGDLTVQAIINVSEEALVLYIKTLSLLARAIDVADAWWSPLKDGRLPSGHARVGGGGVSLPGRLTTAADLDVPLKLRERMVRVLKWSRDRFNKCLKQADLAGKIQSEARRRLPDGHPSKLTHSRDTDCGGITGGVVIGGPRATTRHGTLLDGEIRPLVETSTHLVLLTTNVTAEKLLYDRAVDISRGTVIQFAMRDMSMSGEECQTAVLMFEAILEDPDEGLYADPQDNGDGQPAIPYGFQKVPGLDVQRSEIYQLIKGLRTQMRLQQVPRRSTWLRIGA